MTTMPAGAVPVVPPLEPATVSAEHEPRHRRADVVRGVSRSVTTVRSGAVTLADHAPGAMRATQARVSEATSVLQRLPDSTLRWLAAGSLGVAAGFQLAGAPRLVRAAGAAPALLMGAAIALRPTHRGHVVREAVDDSLDGVTAKVAAPVDGASDTVEQADIAATKESI
jgi:hypothetical protein